MRSTARMRGARYKCSEGIPADSQAMTIRHSPQLPQQVRECLGRSRRFDRHLSGLFLLRDSRGESAQANVGNNRQQESSDKDFEGINEFRHDELINDIESHRDEKYLTDTFPAVLNEVIA